MICVWRQASDECKDNYILNKLPIGGEEEHVHTGLEYLSVLMALYNMDRLAGMAHKKPRKANKPKSKCK